MLADPPERPKIADAPLSVVLLVRPGGAVHDTALQSWLDWLDQRPGPAELLLVFDGLMLKAPAPALTDPRLRIIHHVAPSGVGPTLQSAFALAVQPLLLLAPCDQPFQPADLQRFFDHIDKVDLVLGYRVHRPPPWWLRWLDWGKRLLSGIFLGYWAEPRDCWLGWNGWPRRWVARHIFGAKVRDPECPVRLCRSDAVRHIPLQSIGHFALVELLAKANHLGCWMAEAPLPRTPQESVDPNPSWWADVRLVFREPEFGATPAAPVPAGGSVQAVLS